MPILLIFTLVTACLPLRWRAPLIGEHSFEADVETAITCTLSAVLLSLSAALALRTWVIRTLHRHPGRKIEVAQVYARCRRILFFVNVGLVAICVVVFGWGWLAQQFLSEETPEGLLIWPFAELAVPLPYFVILMGAWLIYFDAERALHRSCVSGVGEREFWSRAGYFINHLRQFALLVMLPVMLFVAQQTAVRYFPESTQTDWYRIASILIVPVMIVFLPLLIKPLLGLRSMPPGPVRTRLEALAKRLHFNCADLLLWPTHGAMANAMIVGLLPPVRYVIFTDRILEELPPEELDAVLGHEIGHAKHGHIWHYALFLGMSITTLVAALLWLNKEWDALVGIEVPKWIDEWLAIPVLMLAGGYIFLVFGYLSRRCERQADVYGCRAVSCSEPHCLGHDETTVYPERARGLCPTGIRTCISALQRVDLLNGGLGFDEHRTRTLGDAVKSFFKWLRSWQHSTMARRMSFLHSLIESPQKERRFQRRVTLLRWGLILGLAAALFGLGQSVGWRALFRGDMPQTSDVEKIDQP